MLRRPCLTHCRFSAAHRQNALNRKTAISSAHQLATTHSAATTIRDEDGKGKPSVQVQLSRPSMPCEKPLPLATVMEVQRLLFILEVPEYCMRAFREHGVNGQDLLHMQDEDLEDSRFKFPRHVQRKVLRIAEAWRHFQALTGGPTQDSLSLERFLEAHRGRGRSPESLSQLKAAFLALDVNDNGHITFEEFLTGFTFLEAAGAELNGPAAKAVDAAARSGAASSASADVAPADGGSGVSAAPPALPASSPSVVSDAYALAGGSSLISGWLTSWFRL